MPIPRVLRVANLRERLDTLEGKQGSVEPWSEVWRAFEADRRRTLAELEESAGVLARLAADHAQRAEVAARDARYGGRGPRIAIVTSAPDIGPTQVGALAPQEGM